MKVWNSLENFDAANPVVTIGIFDGVHMGHRFLLDALKKKAKEINGESVVVTLWPHPRFVLGSDIKNLRYLSSLAEKEVLLKNENIDHLVIIPFTKDFAKLDSCNFIKQYLVEKIKLAHLLVGFNHKFGRDRKGDFKSIKSCSDKYGFTISRIESINDKSYSISSTLIRDLLDQGDLDEANKILGYNYFLIGKVVEGNKIGRTIGFPTANIELEDPNKLLPKTGVYAVYLSCEGKVFKGMLNIGYRPTINSEDSKKTIEVHLFDFDSDLYMKKIALSFRSRMRDERKFQDIEELKDQLKKDKEIAFEILNKLS